MLAVPICQISPEFPIGGRVGIFFHAEHGVMLLHDLIEGIADGMKKKRAGIENITIGSEFNHGKMIVHGMIQCLAFQGSLSFCCQLFFKFRVEHKHTPAKKIESSDISSLTNPSHFLGM
ncbi:hypothetical protein [Aeromonas caviae]